MTDTDLWKFRGDVGSDRADLKGLTVEAIDGKLGKVDEVVTDDNGGTYLVVDTSGLPLIGRTVMVPAGTVTGIDVDNEVIRVDRTRNEVKDAPEYDPERVNDEAFRDALARHYGAH
jgi:hypothetical protein